MKTCSAVYLTKFVACFINNRYHIVEIFPLAPIWIIVRDRLQAAEDRQMLQQRGLGLGIEMASFGDLYNEALEQSGGEMALA